MKKIKLIFIGVLCGILNGLFGAGGGAVLVPMLKRNGIETKKAHATSVIIMLFCTMVSAIIYVVNGKTNPVLAVPYILGGLVGAILGSMLLTKITSKTLKIGFGALLIFAAVRMIIK
jgi:uncharacterized membrane protein YfcA